jgi:predicted PurR-regulated permease PerM
MAVRRKPPIDHSVVLTFLILAIIAALSLAAEVLKPLALAVLLSFALAPLVGFLERRGLPNVAAVLLTVIFALGALAGIGFTVGRQLTHLANHLDDYQRHIKHKIEFLTPSDNTVLARVKKVAGEVEKSLDRPPVEGRKVQDVRVIEQPSFRTQLQGTVGPYLELLGVGSFVLILVLFMLMSRKDLGDRIVRVFGHGHLTLTTRTMDEIGQRISRYLGTFALVNSGFGLVVGLGLWAIGVPYAILWGCMAGMLRFIPYVGPAVAFGLPLIFSFANFEGWRQPLEVVALFGVVEVVLNSFLEPVIYGKTTGISALGLLVAAMFWAWLWGLLGILLSTPLTVCLAVLGKYVPSLRFFATLLGEETEHNLDVRFYQRLLSLDQDGAAAIVEAALKKRPRAEVFDEVLVPALSRAEQDAARGDLEDRDRAFIWRAVGEILYELEETPQISLANPAPSADAGPGPGVGPAADAPIEVAGVASSNTADALVLQMLGQLLAPVGCTMKIIKDTESSLELADRLAEEVPALVVLSHLPPEGLAHARYQVRRVRGRFADLPIVVGRWGESEGASAAVEGLKSAGASQVVFTLAEARDWILSKAIPTAPATPAGALTTV